jgi:hypothetical protein
VREARKCRFSEPVRRLSARRFSFKDFFDGLSGNSTRPCSCREIETWFAPPACSRNDRREIVMTRNLDDLIKAIENGEPIPIDVVARRGIRERLFMDAVEGSEASAKKLHDTLLTGSNAHTLAAHAPGVSVEVDWWPDGLKGGPTHFYATGWHDNSPARAWVLAILRAIKAKEEEDPT